ncbi:DNA recombination protein RmuC [Pseudopontixanthobacter vadosimaris]|uniref:DNA recombination protein RmuC n=1 Tax=Pseudopontixanthobacter vadosimaris TaxID=2726450 RepID=UPI001474C474|nr:DNA recombination protein RmuC [Pseudopontixanthobacter vadosimaris]
MTMTAVLIAIVALLLGLGLGWYGGSRPVAEWRERHATRDAEAREVDEKFRRAVIDLENASVRAGRADDLEKRLQESDAARGEISGMAAGLRSEVAEREKAASLLRADFDRLNSRYESEVEGRRAADNALHSLRSELDEREKAFTARLADREEQSARELARLVAAEEKLQAKFNEIGEKLLTGAQTKFLDTAHGRLEALNKESLAELEKKVGPVGETLERYRKRVEELEKSRVTDFQQLHGVIGEVRAGQERVMEGANRITTTLRGATKARGDWGELQLENLLESCGLYDQADFDCQVSVAGEDGLLRPDAVINIPGGRRLIVDVKNVFNTYARANEADSEEERNTLLRAHARELRGHIDDLSGKRYQDHVKGSADFVVMFIPGEHVLYAALTQDAGLLDYALKRKVVLSSPLNFMSIALTIATVWRQAGVQADAAEIASLGKELYDRLAVVAGHIAQLRKSLQSANQHFDKMVGSFDTNLRRTGERFEELSVDTSAKELPEAPPLNTTPRALVNFATVPADGDDAEGDRPDADKANQGSRRASAS